MSSSRQHGARHPAEEHDPTGVRELLSSLPEPGPMPEHVVLRIQQSLERERQVHQLDSPAAGPGRAGPPAVSELGSRRQRRQQEQARRAVPRWAPWVGAAAAVAAGALVVSAQFLGGAPVADITASLSGTAGQAESARDAGAGADGGSRAAEGGDDLAPMADEESGAGEADAVAPGPIALGDRDAADVEALLQEWYASGPVPSPWGADVAQACLRAARLTPPEQGEPSAYPATWQQQEAVVLLMPDAEEAWVLEGGCQEVELAEVLHGPVPLGQG